jgi:hypothetical protein
MLQRPEYEIDAGTCFCLCAFACDCLLRADLQSTLPAALSACLVGCLFAPCVQGGMVLVSHDFRLIDQVAKEIWVCEKQVSRLACACFTPLSHALR